MNLASIALAAVAADLFGVAACGIEDVNGDGVADLAIGDPVDVPFGIHAQRPGRVRLVSGADGGLLLELEGEQPGDGYGATLAAAGDLDGDGREDLLVGARERGYVQAISTEGALLYTLRVAPDRPKLATKQANQGPALAALGDVDLDGDVDFAVGSAFDDSRGKRGMVRVVDGPGGEVLLEILGEGADDGYGASVCGPGDVDGDGTMDLALGAARDSGETTGYVHLVSPAERRVLLRLQPEGAGPGFGLSLAAIEDLGQGRGSGLLVGARGGAHCFSSETGESLGHWSPPASENRSTFGATLDWLPDLSGDGTPDPLIGRVGSWEAPPASAISFEDGRVLWSFEADSWSDANVGALLIAAPDLDGDGIPEVLAGGGSVRGSFAGVLYVLSGRSGTLLRTLHRRHFTL